MDSQQLPAPGSGSIGHGALGPGKHVRKSARLRRARVTGLFLLGITAMVASAADDATNASSTGWPVSVELRAGLEYDSHVAVLELDRTSGAGDLAALLALGVGYERGVGERASFNAGYHFSQKLHDEFDAFDLRIHRVSGGFSGNIGETGASTGLATHYVSAELDGGRFLVMRQASPHFHKLFGTRLFLRLAYTYTDKDFRANSERSATAHALSSDAYIFLNGLTTYLVLGYRHDREDAIAGHFDYTGHRARAQLTRRVELGSRRLTLRGQARYENRRYRQPTPQIGEPRRDRRIQLEALAELPLGDRTLTRLTYRRGHNRSNLPAISFDEDVWAMSIVLRL